MYFRHVELDSNGQRWTFETSNVIDSNLLRKSIITNVQMYRFAKVTIYLGIAFMVFKATILVIFNLIINYQVDHQI